MKFFFHKKFDKYFSFLIQDRCVEMCSNKNIRVNHKIMSLYMEVQPLIVQKRVEEMEKLNPVVTQTIPEVTEINTVVNAETEQQVILQETSSPEPQVV
jgi:import inner membrane translocase subunit TIM10B